MLHDEPAQVASPPERSDGRAQQLGAVLVPLDARAANFEHPLPDGALAIFMVGLPWSIQQLWGLVKKMLPASEQACCLQQV